MVNLSLEGSTMSSTTIAISIIIPCYNAENKLHKCIHSLNRITFPPKEFEVIFVDDYSLDGTVKLLEEEVKKHKNWQLIRLDKNSGSPSKPRNSGASNAKGKYLFFLDIDDEILPDALKELYKKAKNYIQNYRQRHG